MSWCCLNQWVRDPAVSMMILRWWDESKKERCNANPDQKAHQPLFLKNVPNRIRHKWQSSHRPVHYRTTNHGFSPFLSPSEDANQEKMKIRNVGCRWKSQENSRRSVCKIYQRGGDQIGWLLGKVGRGKRVIFKWERLQDKNKINKKREQSRRWWRWIVWRRETFLLHEFWP